MDPQILLIKMSEESKRWDEMVNRIESYLKNKRDDKLKKRNEILSKYTEEPEITK
jgi:hypothetical protein